MDASISVPEVLKKYFESILYDAHMLTNDVATNSFLVEDLYGKFREFVNERLIDAIPDDKLDAFLVLINKDASQDELDFFLQNNVENVQGVYNMVMVNFRDIYLGLDQYADVTNLPNVIAVK